MPWALELYFLCQHYNKLPTATSILDEEPYLLTAMDNAIAGYRFADKNLKDYEASDHEMNRMIKVVIMLQNGIRGDALKKQLSSMCGPKTFEDGELNIEHLQSLGLGSHIREIYANL